jgi:four helix bundle protein
MENETGNAVLDRSFSFAVRIVNLHKYLTQKSCHGSLAGQLLRSGTSIGANITEAQDAQSKKDFVAKLSIALKEARETKYWIKLLIATQYLDKSQNHVKTLAEELEEIIRLLVTIIKRSKEEDR